MQADEQVRVSTSGNLRPVGEFDELIGRACKKDLETSLHELGAEFLSKEQGIFLFLVRTGVIAGVPAAMARIDTNGFDRRGTSALCRGKNWLEGGSQVELGKINLAIAINRRKQEAHLDAVDLGFL